MLIAIIVLLLICGVLALRLYATEKNIRGAARQLGERGQTGSAVRIDMAAPSAAAEDLLAAVNELLVLREQERAEYQAQEKALRQQISNVSHDLRTPLTSILGYLQLLEGDTLTPEERREYMTVVQSRARSLQSLITSFYDLSRLEGGEYILVKEPVDLRAVLSRLLAEYYNDFVRKGFAVTAELAEDTPPVMADPAGVQRVFINLIRNALEHGATRMEVRLLAEGKRVIVTFANDAPGLTEEDLAHVFDRFYTADKPRTGQSTGLGLAIVQTLTRRMGGQVTAQLAEGMFTVKAVW